MESRQHRTPARSSLWIAETETNMLGYNIYRNEKDNLSDAIAINSKIIQAANVSEPTEYSYVDENVTAGNGYYYWLEMNDLDVTKAFSVPFSSILSKREKMVTFCLNSSKQNS